MLEDKLELLLILMMTDSHEKEDTGMRHLAEVVKLLEAGVLLDGHLGLVPKLASHLALHLIMATTEH